MENPTLIQAIESSLSRLNIQSRSPCSGWYFCHLPNGLTFDLCAKDDTVRLWRYADTMGNWRSCMMRLCELREFFPFQVEITPDGCVSLVVQAEVDAAAFPALLEGFVSIITLDMLCPAHVS